MRGVTDQLGPTQPERIDMTTNTNITAEEHYFGCCPTCHQYDGYLNIGKGHWFYCSEHKIRWCIGSNLFSSWQDETEEDQRTAYAALDFGSYTEVTCEESHCPEVKR
jgi:hypothetical protein